MGPKINLEPFLSDLQRKKEDGETWDELAAWLQEEHNITCDARTIRRRFTDVAGFSAINLGPYMNEIVQQREEGVPFHDIVDNLMGQHVTASPIGTTLWPEGSDHGELEDELKS